MKILYHLLALITVLLFFNNPISAHRTGESYFFLTITDTDVSGRFEVTLEHLNKVINIDRDGDGELTEEEYNQVVEEVNAYMQKTLTFYQNQNIHKVEIISNDGIRHTPNGDFAMIEFTLPSLQEVPDGLDAEYHFLFDAEDTTHRGLAIIENNVITGVINQEANIVGIFGPGDSKKYINFSPKWYKSVYDFIKHGVWHIWIGFDHILFILSLLLSSVMMVRGGKYVPVNNFKEASWNVITLITLFTISHSISLSLAALDVIRLPSRLVEAVIALSIAISALNNITPIYINRMREVVFFFGLFHGFGFANVLAPLGLRESSLISSLFGFNIGVEFGQLVIICLVFPLLYAIKSWRNYNLILLKLSSVVLIAISLIWFIQRAFDL